MKILKRLLLCVLAYIVICFVGMMFYDGCKAADYTSSHTLEKPHCWCAGWVMQGLWHGNCYIALYPAWAYKYVLPLYGFKSVEDVDYQKGDIIVYPAVGKHIFGHIAIYDGVQWVSDFKQRNMVVSPAYNTVKPTLFRHD